MTDRNWTKVIDHGAMEDGDVVAVAVSGREIALYFIDGEYFATDNLCPHGNAKLSDGYLDGHVIECPLHAGLIDVRTGAGCGAPITTPVASYVTRIDGDGVYIVTA